MPGIFASAIASASCAVSVRVPPPAAAGTETAEAIGANAGTHGKQIGSGAADAFLDGRLNSGANGHERDHGGHADDHA